MKTSREARRGFSTKAAQSHFATSSPKSQRRWRNEIQRQRGGENRNLHRLPRRSHNLLPLRYAYAHRGEMEWYFEYLTAIVKRANPRRKVELTICAQQNCLCGAEYVSERTKNLLRAKNIKLKKLRMGEIEDDLFSMAKADNEAKIESVRREIEALERGEFNYYVPPTYINKIKLYLQ